MVLKRCIVLTVLLALLCTGCTSTTSVVIQTEVPEALVQTLPLKVGVFYNTALREHVYLENTEERPNWSIDSGASQIAMLDQVLASTFASVSHLPSLPTRDQPANVDIVIAPNVSEMQFAIPDETFFDFHEAWIRYQIEFHTPQGGSIMSWELTAYGKSPKKRFSGRHEGLSNAVGLALRDIGAKLSTGFPTHAVIIEALETSGN